MNSLNAAQAQDLAGHFQRREAHLRKQEAVFANLQRAVLFSDSFMEEMDKKIDSAAAADSTETTLLVVMKMANQNLLFMSNAMMEQWVAMLAQAKDNGVQDPLVSAGLLDALMVQSNNILAVVEGVSTQAGIKDLVAATAAAKLEKLTFEEQKEAPKEKSSIVLM